MTRNEEENKGRMTLEMKERWKNEKSEVRVRKKQQKK